MRFLRVEIRDFRNIEALDLDLTDPLTDRPLRVAVLVGPNGSGKTAALEAIQRLSMPFSEEAARQGMRPLAHEPRSGCREARLAARYLPNHNERESLSIDLKAPIAEDTPRRFEMVIRSLAGRQEVDPGDHPVTNLNPPPLVYFDAARYVPRGAIQSITAASSASDHAYAAAPSVASRRHQWTKQNIVDLKFAQMLAREQGRDDRSFDRLWEPVHKVLKTVRFREITQRFEILFETPSGPVAFDDLSSGQQSVIVIFADLALYRLSEATVLIDEIELHLHPTWQATILDALLAMLPDCQLIVTTQSPIVAASVRDAKHLFRLADLQEPDAKS